MLDLARSAALEGGRIILQAGTAGASAKGAGASAKRAGASAKGSGDYVTEVDLGSERAITSFLAAETPHVPVLGEEEGGSRGDRYWVVDPLDGTTNFLHGFPVVGVSVALVSEHAPVAGAVHAPFLGQTWLGARGLGAWVERSGARRTLAVSERSSAQAIVATGFPFRRKERLARYLEVMAAALERFEDLRRPGAAALDLAWVAEGVFDGFFELGLAPWDVAAGGLLVEEAGGVVTDWSGGEGWLGGDILAGSPVVHGALRELAARGP